MLFRSYHADVATWPDYPKKTESPLSLEEAGTLVGDLVMKESCRARMDAPESMRLWMLVSSFVTVMMTGMSTTRETASRFTLLRERNSQDRCPHLSFVIKQSVEGSTGSVAQLVRASS